MNWNTLPNFCRPISIVVLVALSWTQSSWADELLLVNSAATASSPLPRGPRNEAVPLSVPVDQMAILPDGRRRAVASGPGPLELTLFKVSLDGQVTALGQIEPDPRAILEGAADLVVSADGGLYLLSDMLVFWNPPEVMQRLVRLDAESGATESAIDVEGISTALAAAPRGFWSLGQETLSFLDLATGTLTDSGFPLPRPLGFTAVSDLLGTLWIGWRGAVCTIPCFGIHRFDPLTGASTAADPELHEGFLFDDLTIHSPCRGNVSRQCMQTRSGAFRVQ